MCIQPWQQGMAPSRRPFPTEHLIVTLHFPLVINTPGAIQVCARAPLW